jgi:DNA-binding GntR family transcriptional regulator
MSERRTPTGSTGTRPSDPSPIRRQVTSELVAEHLRWQIFRGELRPGDRITPERVAEELSVSRLLVREALAVLAHDGLVVMRPHQRAHIGDFDEGVIRDHFEIVGAVQALAAVHLAERDDDGVLADLGALVERIGRARSAEESYDLSMQFHRLINVEGGSSRQRSVLRSLGRMLPRGLFVEVAGAAESDRSGATRILAALRTRDAGAIREALRTVQDERAELIIEHLRSTGVFPATARGPRSPKRAAATGRKSA